MLKGSDNPGIRAGDLLPDGTWLDERDCGCVIGMKTFGAFAPLKELQRTFGFEPQKVVETAKEVAGKL